MIEIIVHLFLFLDGLWGYLKAIFFFSIVAGVIYLFFAYVVPFIHGTNRQGGVDE